MSTCVKEAEDMTRSPVLEENCRHEIVTKTQLQLKALCACQLVTKCLWLLKTSDMCTKITAILGKATGSSKINSNVIVGGSFGPLNLLNALLVFIGFNLLNSSYLSASACVLYTFFCC